LSLYFKILAGAFILPFLLSFDRKVAFYKGWKYLFPSIILSAAVFIPWDVIFTRKGVWGFSKEYLAGVEIFSLPLEEWLFFAVIPYASVFTFEVVRAYFPGLARKSFQKFMGMVLMLLSLVMIIVFRDRIYTLATFSLTFLLLFLHHFIFRTSWLNELYVAYLLILFPFMIVNGLLTGASIPGEVVWYNPERMIGLRAVTVPVEDFFYGFSLILLNLGFYNFFRKKAIW
jgi:lycopene cyclase domain-containing protein